MVDPPPGRLYLPCMAGKAWMRLVRKEHGSLLVAFPREAMAALGLKGGDYVKIMLSEKAGALVVKPVDVQRKGRRGVIET